MSQKHQKPKTKKITPTWEEEESPSAPVDARPSPEDEARMFHEALRTDKIPIKDREIDRKSQPERTIRKKQERHDIDLHGMTVSEAQDYVINAIETILGQAKGQPVEIRIITGKGHRSRGREPQLVHSIHHVVEAKFRHRLISIEVSPHELKVGDTFLKGHFDLKIR